MIKGLDKRGESSTITIIIAIVLGVAVLVFLVFGFTSGWNNMWDRVTNLGGGKANLGTIESACNLACSTGSVGDYCRTNRTVKFEDTQNKIVTERGTCEEVQKNSTRYGGLKLEACPAITCS